MNVTRFAQATKYGIDVDSGILKETCTISPVRHGLHQLARLCQDILSLRMMPGGSNSKGHPSEYTEERIILAYRAVNMDAKP